MSAKLTMRVFESALPPRLKATAGVLALFADEDGENIYPSLRRLAWLVGKAERHVRADVKELRERGVLVPLTPMRRHETTGAAVPVGGRYASTRYRLDREALPSRAAFEKNGRPTNSDAGVPLSDQNRDGSVPLSLDLSGGKGGPFEQERVTFQTERGTILTGKGDASVTRSSSDPPIDPPERKNAAAPHPATTDEQGNGRGTVSRQPARNVSDIAGVAATVMAETGRFDAGDTGVAEIVQQRCAEHGIDCGSDPEDRRENLSRAMHVVVNRKRFAGQHR